MYAATGSAVYPATWRREKSGIISSHINHAKESQQIGCCEEVRCHPDLLAPSANLPSPSPLSGRALYTLNLTSPLFVVYFVYKKSIETQESRQGQEFSEGNDVSLFRCVNEYLFLQISNRRYKLCRIPKLNQVGWRLVVEGKQPSVKKVLPHRACSRWLPRSQEHVGAHILGQS